MRPAPLLVQAVALALWLGAAIFFASVVAPALFAVLPSRTLAGAVVGRLLPIVFYAGILIGALALLLEWAGGSGWTWGVRSISAIAMIVACGVAQLIVGPRIERIRGEIPGPIENLPLDDARRVAFGRLHGVSVAWMGLAMLAAAVALVSAARHLQSRR
jgi:hypothetical protein